MYHMITVDRFGCFVRQRDHSLRAVRRALTERGFFYAAGVDALPADYISDVYAYLDQVWCQWWGNLLSCATRQMSLTSV